MGLRRPDVGRLRPIGQQLGFEDLGGEGGEVDWVAAGGDRLEEHRRFGGEQDQVDVGRGLLQRLQQGVLALVAHLLGGLDHEDALVGFEWTVGRRADHLLANLLDHVLGPAWPQPNQVGMRRGIDEDAAASVVWVCRVNRQDLGREGARNRALSRPARAAEEVGVRGTGEQGRAQRHSRSRLMLRRALQHRAHRGDFVFTRP